MTSADAAIVGWVDEALEPLGKTSTKRFFSGTGLYLDGMFFAFIIGGDLFLKADPVSDPLFDARNLDRFEYRIKGKMTAIGFRRAPDEVFDDPEAMQEWARVALAAALRKAA